MKNRGNRVIDALCVIAAMLAVASPFAVMFVNLGIGAYLVALALFLIISAVLLVVYSKEV